MSVTSTLTSKGQITIPKEMREDLSLKPGDKVSFVKIGGRYVVQPRTGNIADSSGMLRREGQRPHSVEELSEATMDAAVAEYRRSVR